MHKPSSRQIYAAYPPPTSLKWQSSLRHKQKTPARASLTRCSGKPGRTREPVTEEHAHAARQAYSDFGKGRHPAGLNFGDCFSYALAKITGEPLLFEGKDFKKTDIASALETGGHPPR